MVKSRNLSLQGAWQQGANLLEGCCRKWESFHNLNLLPASRPRERQLRENLLKGYHSLKSWGSCHSLSLPVE
jgi:hypothetical protein